MSETKQGTPSSATSTNEAYEQLLSRASRDDGQYRAELAAFGASYRDSEKTFDQSLLTMTAAGLALSMTFRKDIATSPAIAPSLLGCCWLTWGIAIVLLLINLRISASLSLQSARVLDRHFENYDPNRNPWPAIRAEQHALTFGLRWLKARGHRLIHVLNAVNVVLFSGGALLLGIFAYRNFH
jgi:hypothetical protein